MRRWSSSRGRAWFWALLMTVGPGALRAQPTVEQVLDSYANRFGKVTYTAVEQLEERQADNTLAKVTNSVKQAPGKERSAYVSGPTAYRGVIMADDGKQLKIYIPVEKRCYVFGSHSRYAAKRRQEELVRLRDKFDARLVGQQTVAGRPSWHVKLTSKAKDGPELDVWIDSREYVALRQDLRSRGNTWRRSEYSRVNFGASLAAKEFEYNPPGGTKIIKMPGRNEEDQHPSPYQLKSPGEVREKANLRLLQPKYLPPSYTFDGIYLYPPTPNGIFQRRLATRYVSGGNVLMFNQGVVLPGRRGGVPHKPPTEPTELRPGVLFWAKYGIRCLLIGPRGLDGNELMKCAESVDWYRD